MNILVSLDGVLRSENGEPIRAGVVLYYSLNNGHRVALMTKRKKEDAEHWLHSHGIIGYDDLIDDSFGLEGEDLKRRQFVMSRSRAPIEMYVDSDPAMCAWVFEKQGIPIVLFNDPSFLPVEWRPDAPKKVRAWSEIEDSITRVNVARSKDAIRPEESDLWQD